MSYDCHVIALFECDLGHGYIIEYYVSDQGYS